jgi:hypothetical protein
LIVQTDSVKIHPYTARLIIKDLETGDMYKKLYDNEKLMTGVLHQTISIQSQVITNQDKQIEFNNKIIGGYETVNTQLIDIVKLTNSESKKQNTVIFSSLAIIIAILVIKK